MEHSKAPTSSPVHVLARSDSAQIRLQYLPNLEGIDARIYRKSPSELDDTDAYLPTPAGFVVPKDQLRAFLGVLAEILREIEA